VEYRVRTPPVVRRLMDEYGVRAREAIFRFLPDREPRRYLYDLIAEYPRRGGRCMRPAICIASARAHGAPIEHALATATFVELLHNALLVIDDIQDGSEERRSKPTLHREHGMPVALNVGCTMSILSLVPLLDNVGPCGPHVALALFERAVEVAQLSAEGQALELGWRLENVLDISVGDYLDMVLRKTCAYSTMFPMRAGAIIGGGHTDADPSVIRYAFLVGVAFQIQDDILNLTGDHARYGKEIGGDLLEGKRTLLTIRLMERARGPERRFVEAFFGKPRELKTDAEVARLRELLDRYDCIPYARTIANQFVGAAQHEFSRALERLPPSPDKEFLRGLSTWIIEQT